MRFQMNWTILMLALSVGCGTSGEGKNSGWKLGDDAGPDAGGDVSIDDSGADSGGDSGGGTDAGVDVGLPPGAITFTLTNEHTNPVFAYHGVSGGISCFDGAWLEILEDGEPRRIVSDCSRCSCDDGPDCAVCAIDCAPGADPNYAQLSVGESRSFVWDGLLRVDAITQNGQCEALRAPQSTGLSARFCWGHSFEETSGPFGLISTVVCEDVDFDPSDVLVEHTILPTARDEVQFELSNGTTEMRYAHFSAGGPCDSGTWLSLEREGTPLRIIDYCGQCSCTEVDDASMCPQPCPAIACPQPTSEAFELPPGGLRRHSWSRVAYTDEEVNGIACERDRLVTGPLTARLCWGNDVDESLQLIGETCETIEFDPMQDNDVRHLIVN